MNNARRKHRLLLTTLAVPFAFAVSMVTAAQSADTKENRSAQGNRTTREQVYIEQQKDLIKLKLKDPKSAQFRNVRVCYAMGPIVVGEVNSNNSFGGKSGFQRFVSGGDVHVLEEEMEAGAMNKVWASVCP